MEQEFKTLQEEVQRKRMYNSQRFLGGYTEPAKLDYEVEEKRIVAYEEEQKKKIQEKYKENSLPSIKKTRLGFSKKQVHPINSIGFPIVGGSAAFHAAAHGGGFNHPGYYGSPFQ